MTPDALVELTHDLNNLLGVILNYATLLARRETELTALADLGEICEAARRAVALTARLNPLTYRCSEGGSGVHID